jgi:hypothetical protein
MADIMWRKIMFARFFVSNPILLQTYQVDNTKNNRINKSGTTIKKVIVNEAPVKE